MKVFLNKAFSSTVNRLEIEITSSGYVHAGPEWNIKEMCSPYSRIYFVESGEFKVSACGKEITMKPGHVYIIPTGLVFNGHCDNAYTKLYFHFCINRPDGYDLLSECSGILSCNIGKDGIERIKNLFFSENLVDTLKLKNEILGISLSLLPEENIQHLASVVYSPQVQSAIDYIKDHLSIQLSVKTLSDNLFVAQTTLSKHFREEVGVNIGKYIDDIVFENAKKLLIKTDMPIMEISEKFGFCDRFYFSRRFKEKFDFTPYKYRKLNSTTLS